MDKLFDLMIMMVKYQLTVATGPREVILIVLNHIDGMREMVSDANVQKCITSAQKMIIDVSTAHSSRLTINATKNIQLSTVLWSLDF